MSEEELEARVAAVERALADSDTTVADLSDAAAVHERLDDVDARLGVLAERVDALDATVQSLHGYVGELEHVNDRVERRADAARAAVERLDGRQNHPGTSDADPSTVDSSSADAEVRHREPTNAAQVDGPTPTDTDATESLLDRVRDSL